MKQKTLITIIGNVASGKSTLTRLLADHLSIEKLEADDLFQTQNPLAELFLADMKRWGFTNEIWMTYHRANLIAGNVTRSANANTIIDSGLFMNWVYAYSHFTSGIFTSHEWDLYQKIYDISEKNFSGYSQVVISLHYPFPVLLKRINKRGRDYELRQYKRTYLRQLDAGITDVERKIRDANIPLIVITEKDVKHFEDNGESVKYIAEKLASCLT